MYGIRCILRDSNRIGVQFLFTDLDVALSFLTIAAASGDTPWAFFLRSAPWTSPTAAQ